MLNRRHLLAVAGCLAGRGAMAEAPVDRLLVGGLHLRCGTASYRCAVGHGGVRTDKAEGDGATPIGRFPLRQVLYRPDRIGRVATGLPVRALQADDGWCDAPDDAQYNRLVKLPFAASHEVLWRADGLYDLIVVVGYNDEPVTSGRGSAIFLHVARADFGPTDGCVALARPALLDVLARCGPQTMLEVTG